MRIAFFTETFLPKMDGIVTTLCQTIHQLGGMGHEVLIFAPEAGVTEFENFRVVGMKSRTFPLYPELHLAFPRASMRKILTEFRPDVLHVADPALLGIAALYYGGGKDGGALRVPVVVSYHTDLPRYLRYYGLGFLQPYVWKILRFRHQRATMNLCTSELMVSELKEHAIAPVELWPGGVDADLFRPCRGSAEMRQRLTEGDADRPLLLYVGRLSAEKNLESLRCLLEAFPDARLALVGDGPHRRELEKHFAGLPVFFAGFLYREELASAYGSSDIFVMPSRTETLGLVVLEAMASGLPVVAARAGGIPEMIQDEVSGYLYDTDGEAIERVGLLLGSKDRREIIGRRARAVASARSWKNATAQLVSQYEDAIAKQALGPRNAESSPPLGLAGKAQRALRRSIIFTARKLLP
jgi:glycosyltransferase involved in cell wall biosynthesis